MFQRSYRSTDRRADALPQRSQRGKSPDTGPSRMQRRRKSPDTGLSRRCQRRPAHLQRRPLLSVGSAVSRSASQLCGEEGRLASHSWAKAGNHQERHVVRRCPLLPGRTSCQRCRAIIRRSPEAFVHTERGDVATQLRTQGPLQVVAVAQLSFTYTVLCFQV